jgi:hypothetical protein
MGYLQNLTESSRLVFDEFLLPYLLLVAKATLGAWGEEVGAWGSGWVISLRETEVCNRLIESQKGGTGNMYYGMIKPTLPIILCNVPAKAHYNKLGNAPNIKVWGGRLCHFSFTLYDITFSWWSFIHNSDQNFCYIYITVESATPDFNIMEWSHPCPLCTMEWSGPCPLCYVQ